MKRWAILVLCVFLEVIVAATLFCIWNTPYRKMRASINAACEETGAPKARIAAMCKTESGFKENARSAKGACGVMQLLPSTAQAIAALYDIPYQENTLFDPEKNVRLGCCYYCYLAERFEGDWILAAYNAGETVARKWINEGVALSSIPYKETRDYIRKVRFYEKIYALL